MPACSVWMRPARSRAPPLAATIRPRREDGRWPGHRRSSPSRCQPTAPSVGCRLRFIRDGRVFRRSPWSKPRRPPARSALVLRPRVSAQGRPASAVRRLHHERRPAVADLVATAAHAAPTAATVGSSPSLSPAAARFASGRRTQPVRRRSAHPRGPARSVRFGQSVGGHRRPSSPGIGARRRSSHHRRPRSAPGRVGGGPGGTRGGRRYRTRPDYRDDVCPRRSDRRSERRRSAAVHGAPAFRCPSRHGAGRHCGDRRSRRPGPWPGTGTSRGRTCFV